MQIPEPAELSRLNKEEGLTFQQLADRYDTTKGVIAGRVQRFRAGLEWQGEAPPSGWAPPPAPTVEVRDDGNAQEIESAPGGRITTLAELLAFCQVDPEKWIVERHVVNKWEVGAKDPNGQIVVEPLFQVKAWLVQRHPEAVKPVIQPVNINIHYPRPPQKVRGMKAALIVSDTQFGFARDIMRGTLTPFHDRRALDLVLQIARLVEPDMAVLLGDVNDYSGWSDRFIRRPEFYFTTQPSLIEASWFIGQVRQLTADEVYALEGNHDLRPENQIVQHLMEAYGLRSADCLDAAPVMSVDNLLGLSRMGVKYMGGYPSGEVWINATTKCIHGDRVRAQPGATATAVVREVNENTIYGHIHRREMATRTVAGRHGQRTVTACCPGCLCHIDGRVPGSSKNNQWQQGIAVVWYDEEQSAIQFVDIHEGRAIFDGELLEAGDYVADLRKDTAWEF